MTQESYDERLTVPGAWWALVLVPAIALGLIFYPFGTVPSFIGAVVGVLLSALALSSYGSARIRVVRGVLLAGDARVPITALGEAHVLGPEDAISWRRERADASAFMLLRSYVPTALRVEVTDPEDPTPYLYLSTREPARLAAALRAQRPAQV